MLCYSLPLETSRLPYNRRTPQPPPNPILPVHLRPTLLHNAFPPYFQHRPLSRRSSDPLTRPSSHHPPRSRTLETGAQRRVPLLPPAPSLGPCRSRYRWIPSPFESLLPLRSRFSPTKAQLSPLGQPGVNHLPRQLLLRRAGQGVVLQEKSAPSKPRRRIRSESTSRRVQRGYREGGAVRSGGLRRGGRHL